MLYKQIFIVCMFVNVDEFIKKNILDNMKLVVMKLF